MKKFKLPILLGLFFIITVATIVIPSCVEQTKKVRVYGCTPTERKKVQEFIQTSIKNANNMSDEEMEDVILQLQHTAIKTTCGQCMVDMANDQSHTIITQNDSINYYEIGYY